MKKIVLRTALAGLALALTVGNPRAQEGPMLGGGLFGGGIGSRLQTLRNRMTNKDPSIQYNPSVLRPGTPRSQVVYLLGEPNGTQMQNSMQEDVYAFFPDGSTYVDPQITRRHDCRGGFHQRHVAGGQSGEEYDPAKSANALRCPLRRLPEHPERKGDSA